jgi:uncharacterized membrane protein YebE (DUF533 family)
MREDARLDHESGVPGMNLNSVLNSVLRGGLGSVLGGGGARGGGGLGGALGGMGGQAAALAALGLLLRGGRANSLLKLGGMAALGALAYKAWQDYQAKQQQAGGGAPATPPFGTGTPPAARFVGDATPAPQAEAHSRAVLAAMIAAAKADGHVDDQERAQIEQALRGGDAGGAADAELTAWFEQELRRPLDPAEVARAAGGDGALAAEVYLASVLVASGSGGAAGTMERLYLDALARELKLPDGLKASLQAQAAQAAAG